MTDLLAREMALLLQAGQHSGLGHYGLGYQESRREGSVQLDTRSGSSPGFSDENRAAGPNPEARYRRLSTFADDWARQSSSGNLQQEPRQGRLKTLDGAEVAVRSPDLDRLDPITGPVGPSASQASRGGKVAGENLLVSSDPLSVALARGDQQGGYGCFCGCSWSYAFDDGADQLTGLPGETSRSMLQAVAGLNPAAGQGFTDVTAAVGISGGAGSWAGVWGDYDRDGLLDLFTIGHLQPATGGKNQLWRAVAPGQFVDATAEANMLSDKIDTHGALWSDLDRDGDLDLLLLNESITDKPQLYNELWRNNADGTFTEVGAAANVLALDHITRGLAAADFNRDGLLDIFGVVQDISRFPNTPPNYSPNNLLWRNDGNLQFTDVGVAAGVAMPDAGGKRTAAWADYDNDGWPDLIVMPDSSLYRNNGDGTFIDVTIAAGIVRSDQSQGASWADYDNDGDLDLFVTRGFNTPTSSLLYQNNGDGTFADVTESAGIFNTTLARSAAWGDYDNDGLLDLYIVNFKNATTPNRLYRNNGNGTFSDVTVDTGTAAQVPGGGAHGGWVDYDDDGFLDLFITNGESTNTGPYVLLRNGGNSNDWLKLRPIGVASNPEAVGARARVQPDVGDLRYGVNTGSAHWMSQSNLPMHFGMGTSSYSSSIEITWPSGLLQTLENIGNGQTVTVTEGEPIYAGAPSMISEGFTVSKTGNRWRLEWKASANRNSFTGRVSVGRSISNVASIGFEANDRLTLRPNAFTFSATATQGEIEAIEFEAVGRVVTFDIKQDRSYNPSAVAIGRHAVRPGLLPLKLRQ
jgi:hypothetical protein